MQTLHTHHFPAVVWLLLSTVGCSSSTHTESTHTVQSNALNPNNSSLLSETDGIEAPSREVLTQAAPDLNSDLNSDSNPGATNSFNSDGDLRINLSNYEQIAKSTVQTINLTELNTELDNARELLSKLNEFGWTVVAGGSGLSGLTLASQENNSAISEEYSQGDYSLSFICDDGGLLTIQLKDFNGGPFYHNSANFDNCHLNGQVHNGKLESSGARRAPDLTIFTDYTRTSKNQSINITGEHEHLYPVYGITDTNSWKDTSFVLTNSAGTVKVDNINWQMQGRDGPNLDSNPEDIIQGFVMLPDGTIQRVVQYEYVAKLQTSFNFTPAQLPGENINVVVNLSYQSSYFAWEGNHLTGFDTPTFPVADLGATIDVFSDYAIQNGKSQLFDSLPKDQAPQWQDGGIRITASDATSMILKPDPSNVDAVLIELNDTGEQISRLWSEGYQVACPVNVGVCK